MKLNVKLYGTLGRLVDQYDHQSGLEVIMPEGTTVGDLLLHLNIALKGIGMIFVDNGPATENTCLNNEARIRIFQPIAGG